MTTLYQSVERALAFSPRLQALVHGNNALQHDLKQARARYRPSIDLLLGYGVQQHNDSTTRLPDADPSDSEWYSRGDATLKLTQKVYDGGETKNTISIQQAILDSADLSLKEATQDIALNAIRAHLEVYRQRTLVDLAERDLQIHQDIYQALADIEKAGYGNIADVTQTQTRMAQAQSALIGSQNGLREANSNYERVVGAKPGELDFAELPQTTPGSLEDALMQVKQNNPGLMAFDAKIEEAEARVNLARSSYQPKINIELSSRYNDQLEGDPSYQHTNDAMLVMRWNLYNGGQDKEAASAALARKYQSRSNRDDKQIELRESTAVAWTNYLSLQNQKNTFREAVISSNKTFDAYMKQYTVSRRSLLDVLNAEKEYFQSARQLIQVSVDEITTAYRILNLIGELRVAETSVGSTSNDLGRLAQAIDLPPSVQLYRTPSQTLTTTPVQDSSSESVVNEGQNSLAQETGPKPVPRNKMLLAVEIGPCSPESLMEHAMAGLQDLGFNALSTSCIRKVKVYRLLEGRYTKKTADARLKITRQSVEAFAIPEGDKLAIYVGSFHKYENAVRHAEMLAKKNIKSTPILAEIEKPGNKLMVQQIDQLGAETISEKMSELGLTTKTITSP